MLSNRWAVLVLLFGVRAGMGLQYQVVGALSPLFMAEYSIGVGEIGLLIGFYHAPGPVLAFVGGSISARLGDRPAALAGLVLMIAGELIALVPAWPMLVTGRLCAGAGGIVMNVAMAKMVTDWFAGRELATAMAVIGNAAPVGIALALLLFPVLAAAGGRILVSAAVVTYAAMALVALAALYRAPPAWQPHLLKPTAWLRGRNLFAVLAAGLIYGLYNLSLIVVIAFGPLMLTERGWTMAAATSVTSVALWLAAISLPAGGWVADWSGHNSAVLIGGLAGFAAALLLSSRVGSVLPAFVVLGLLSGIPCGPIMSLPGRVLSAETRATGMGVFFSVYYLANVIGPWLVRYSVDAVGDPAIAFDLGSAFLVIGGLIWVAYRAMAIRAPVAETTL